MEEKTSYELSREADKFLKQHGIDIWGRPKIERNYHQDSFEYRMQKGAYSNNSERRKR
jgi:hypothetical protein